MTPSERTVIDRAIEAGEPVTLGVLPDLDPIAAEYAELWSTLRQGTPGDDPISLVSMLLMTGDEREMHRVRPILHQMDGVLFESQREKREADRKKSEADAKRRRRK